MYASLGTVLIIFINFHLFACQLSLSYRPDLTRVWLHTIEGSVPLAQFLSTASFPLLRSFATLYITPLCSSNTPF